MLRWMIASGYGDPKTLERRAQAMEEWIENPELLKPDENAEYAEIIEIDLNEKEKLNFEKSIKSVKDLFQAAKKIDNSL